MEKLSAGLQAAIKSYPLKTVVRSQDNKVNDAYAGVTHIIPNAQKLKIPDDFDGREVWVGLLPPVMNQGQCGSCWAFASTGALAARFNIQSMGLLNIQLSTLKLILCDLQGAEIDVDTLNTYGASRVASKALSTSACYGNSLMDASRYLYDTTLDYTTLHIYTTSILRHLHPSNSTPAYFWPLLPPCACMT